MDDEDDGTAPIMRWWRRDSSESSARAMVDGWLDGLLVGARRRKNIKMNPPLGERENLREKRIVRRHAWRNVATREGESWFTGDELRWRMVHGGYKIGVLCQ